MELIRIGEASYPAKGRRKTVRHLRRRIGRELPVFKRICRSNFWRRQCLPLGAASRSVSVL